MPINIKGDGRKPSSVFRIISGSNNPTSDSPGEPRAHETNNFPDQSGYVDSDDAGERRSGKKSDQTDTDNPY